MIEPVTVLRLPPAAADGRHPGLGPLTVPLTPSRTAPGWAAAAAAAARAADLEAAGRSRGARPLADSDSGPGSESDASLSTAIRPARVERSSGGPPLAALATQRLSDRHGGYRASPWQ
jgi:hypothetical protein